MAPDTHASLDIGEVAQTPQADSFTAALEEKVKNDPHDAQSLLMLGHSYYLSGRIGLAIQTLKAAIAVNPKLPQAYYHLGVAYYRSAWLDEAVHALIQVTEMAPDMIMAFYWLGVVYYHKGMYAESRKAFETLLEKNHETSIAHYHAALACIADNVLDRARDHLDALVKEGHGDPQVYLLLGNAHYRLRQTQQAVDVFRRGLSLNPDNKALQSALEDLTNVQEP